jgi:hypothetical protein
MALNQGSEVNSAKECGTSQLLLHACHKDGVKAIRKKDVEPGTEGTAKRSSDTPSIRRSN